MPHTPKIATCCYCGTRAALVLEKGRHELSCAACGAPLHNLKQMHVTPDATSPKRVKTGRPAALPDRAKRPEGRPKKYKKPKKSRARWIIGEIFDVVEDIFD